MQVTFEDLNKGAFTQTLAKLSNKDGYATLSAALKVAKMLKQVEESVLVAREQHVGMLNKYAKRKEDGTFETPENIQPGDAPYIIKPECEEDYNKQMDDFMKTEITIEASALKASELGTVRLTPSEILSLGDAFEVDEETI